MFPQVRQKTELYYLAAIVFYCGLVFCSFQIDVYY